MQRIELKRFNFRAEMREKSKQDDFEAEKRRQIATFVLGGVVGRPWDPRKQEHIAKTLYGYKKYYLD